MINRSLALILFLLLSSLLSLGQRLKVSEVSVQIEGQNLKGFQVVLPQKSSTLKRNIHSHLDAYGLRPTESGNLFTCRQVVYSRISFSQPITIYHYLESLVSEQTRLTVIVLNGARTNVTSKNEFDIALRTLIDLRKFTQKYVRKDIEFEYLFPTHRTELAEMKVESKVKLVAQVDDSSQITTPKTEQVTRSDDTPKANTRPSLEQVSSMKNAGTSPSDQAYKDTIRILKDGIYGYEQLLREQENFIDSLLRVAKKAKGVSTATRRYSRPISKPVSPQHNTARLQATRDSFNLAIQKINSEKTYWERRAKQVKNKFQTAMTSKNKAEAELSAKSRELSLLRTSLDQKLTDLKSQKQTKQKEVIQLAQHKTMNPEGWARADKLAMQLNKTREALVVAKKERDEIKHDYKSSASKIDSLLSLGDRLLAYYRGALKSKDSLLIELDLITPYAKSIERLRHVYQQQLTQLASLEKRIPLMEQQLYAREKRIDQREKYLREYDQTGRLNELLDKVKTLEDQNAKLASKLAEKRPDIISSLGGEVYSGNIRLSADNIAAAYCMDTDQSGLAIRDRIIAFMRRRGQMPDKREPLTYHNALISGISELPVTLIFDISDKISTGHRRVALAVKLRGGDYISAAHSPTQTKAMRELMDLLFK